MNFAKTKSKTTLLKLRKGHMCSSFSVGQKTDGAPLRTLKNNCHNDISRTSSGAHLFVIPWSPQTDVAFCLLTDRNIRTNVPLTKFAKCYFGSYFCKAHEEHRLSFDPGKLTSPFEAQFWAAWGPLGAVLGCLGTI